MIDFYVGLINILAFGYYLLCIGWIYVCYTEYIFRKELRELNEVKPHDMPAPYDNCQFKHCDLRGQCLGEGKCHHPIEKDN